MIPMTVVGAPSRFTTRPTIAAIMTSQSELDGSHATLEISAVYPGSFAILLLDRQTRQRLFIVPSPQRVRELGRNHLRRVQIGIAKFPEGFCKLNHPIITWIAISNAMQKQQNRFVRQENSIRPPALGNPGPNAKGFR